MTANVSIVILSAEQLAELTTTMLLLEQCAAGYDRLRTAYDQLKAAHATELRKAEGDAAYINELFLRARNAEEQVVALRDRIDVLSKPNDCAALERAYDELREKHLVLGRQNIALAAEAEGRELTEQQLTAADARIRELEAALAVAKLPAGSRDNVIQMVREAAA